MIKNLTNKFIKHKEFKDVCFFVQKYFIHDGSLEVDGEWINQGFIYSWYLDTKETLKIKDIDGWLMVSVYHGPCLRYAKWESILI